MADRVPEPRSNVSGTSVVPDAASGPNLVPSNTARLPPLPPMRTAKSESPPLAPAGSGLLAPPPMTAVKPRRGSSHTRSRPPMSSKPKARAYSSSLGAAAAAAGSSSHHRAQIAASLATRRHSSSSATPPVVEDAKPTRAQLQQLQQQSQQAGASNTKPLNTHSPLAIAAAAAVTPEKIRRLLTTQGPLAIRHITAHLILTIPGFGNLSLSKQRRLIIAVLDSTDPDQTTRFIKVGWGRWAVETDGQPAPRESISQNLPSNAVPLSPRLRATTTSDELAIVSDSESESDDDDDDNALASSSEPEEGTDEEDWRALGPGRLLPRDTSPREQDAIAALVQLGTVERAYSS